MTGILETVMQGLPVVQGSMPNHGACGGGRECPVTAAESQRVTGTESRQGDV